jgi:hypothetical protein
VVKDFRISELGRRWGSGHRILDQVFMVYGFWMSDWGPTFLRVHGLGE